MEVLQPCRLTDQIRPNTAGENRQQGSKGRKEGKKEKRGRGGMGGGNAFSSMLELHTAYGSVKVERKCWHWGTG